MSAYLNGARSSAPFAPTPSLSSQAEQAQWCVSGRWAPPKKGQAPHAQAGNGGLGWQAGGRADCSLAQPPASRDYKRPPQARATPEHVEVDEGCLALRGEVYVGSCLRLLPAV